MKIHSKKQNKIIITIIVIIMLCNFVMPNYSYAETDTKGGGKLLNYIAEFLCFVPDAVLNLFQRFFVSTDTINENGEYKILYSPGIIFAGGIPAFDIDFINAPKDNKGGLLEEKFFRGKIGEWEKLSVSGNTESDHKRKFETAKTTSDYKFTTGKITESVDIGDPWAYTESLKTYNAYYIINEEDEVIDVCCEIVKETSAVPSYYSAQFKLSDLESEGYYKYYLSSATILQGIIASWYKALRRIALVGLLSVLVYIGIRIVLSSSSAQDSSKYKKMLLDWVIAICILFMLHYLMNLTIITVKGISNFFKPSVIGADSEDILMSNVRNSVANALSFSEAIVQVVIYDILAVYTVIFSIQYFKRTIYLAFLTMIAPLITLTYPLDKIKDSKAQAFDMWLKDYIFFTLLQVVHLLVYWVLLGSSLDLAKEGNWIFAIIALGFLTQAEKIIKKMFGFEKSSSMGALAAGASGALIMNAINKIKSSSKASSGAKKGAGGGSGGGEGTNKGVRTASIDPLASLKQDENTPKQPEPQTRKEAREARREEREKEREERRKEREEFKNLDKEGKKEKIRERDAARLAKLNAIDDRITKKIKGVQALGGRYVRPVFGKAVGGLGAMAGGAVGFAAGASQGDIGKALTGLAAGGAAGYYGGQRATNAVFNTGSKMLKLDQYFDEMDDTYNEAALGKAEAQNIRFDREFKNSSAYTKLQANKNFSERNIDSMLEAGITDEKDMDKILTNIGRTTSTNGSDERTSTIEDEIGYYQLAKECPDSVFYNKDKNALAEYIRVKIGKSNTNIPPGLAAEIANAMEMYK